MFENCKVSPNSKYNNFANFRSRLNGTRFQRWRRRYRTPKRYCEHSDKTRLFSVNQLGFTRVESKYCMGRLWNELYSMSTCVEALPTAPIIVMMWQGFLWHSLELTPPSLRSPQTVVSNMVNHRAYVHFKFFNQI